MYIDQEKRHTISQFSIRLDPYKTIKFLLKIVLILDLLSLFTQFSLYFLPDFPMRDVLIHKFDVDGEMNFPALFSFMILMTSAGFLYLISLLRKSARDPHARSWKLLSFIFVYLGLDELLALHERFMPPLRAMGANGFFYNAWVIPFGFLVVVFGITFFRFWINLIPQVRTLFLIAFVFYVTGALGFELIDGFLTYKAEVNTFLYSVIATIEDGLEMIGICIFIRGLMTYLNLLNVKSATLNLNSGNLP